MKLTDMIVDELAKTGEFNIADYLHAHKRQAIKVTVSYLENTHGWQLERLRDNDDNTFITGYRINPADRQRALDELAKRKARPARKKPQPVQVQQAQPARPQPIAYNLENMSGAQKAIYEKIMPLLKHDRIRVTNLNHINNHTVLCKVLRSQRYVLSAGGEVWVKEY